MIGLSMALRSFCALFWATSFHAPVLAHPDLVVPSSFHAHDHDHHTGHDCGTATPSQHKTVVDQLRLRAAFDDNHGGRRLQVPTACTEMCEQCIEVEVYLHMILGNLTSLGPIIPHPTDVVLDLINDVPGATTADLSTEDDINNLFQNNVDIVNQAFVGTPFRFRFVREATTQTISNDWSNDGAEFQPEMSKALGSGELTKMHVFLVWNVRQSGGGLTLGIASLPAAQIADDGDGMIMRYDVLPSGGLAPRDLGFTLVHEIGHWMGLLHTFQTLLSAPDACDSIEQGFGDLVDDTPVQAGPSSSNPESCVTFLESGELPDTCPLLDGDDPLYNYMNYVDDDRCQLEQGEFTCGQIERMYRHWLLFREEATSCDAADMELEFIIGLDTNYLEETSMRLINESGDLYFDSVSDHRIAVLIFEQDTLIIDLCVPRGQIYTFIVQDLGENGFSNGGFVETYVDRRFVDYLTGDFGSFTFVQITEDRQTISQIPSAQPSRAPSESPSLSPTVSRAPSQSPSVSALPTTEPSVSPSSAPSTTSSPTAVPSTEPTDVVERSAAASVLSFSSIVVAAAAAASLALCGWAVTP